MTPFDFVKSIVEKHGGKLLSVASGTGAGGGVYFGEMKASGSTTGSDMLLENLDKALTVNLFLSIAGVSMAIVALLLPHLVTASDKIAELRRNNDLAGEERLSEFLRFVRAQKRMIACFLLCLAGVANSFVFDGVLEYVPPNLMEASMPAHLANFAGPEWADLVEGVSSTAILVSALAFLGLGAKSFLTAINKYNEVPA